MTIAGYLAATPEPGVEDVRTALAGNICRCTGYVRIVDATLVAARRMRESGAVPS